MPFGVDLDSVLGYYTIKYAHIADRRLGIIQKGLMLLILTKIVAMTIVMNCAHLLEVPVMGSARANSQQPTKNTCDPMDGDCMSDFTPMSKLPYCDVFKAPAADAEEDGKRKLQDAKIPQATCEYWDAAAMTRGRSPVPGTLFMPTRITSYKQVEGCKPDESNDFKCTTKPWVHAGGDYKSTMAVADVERFTILINQAFSADMPGGGPDLKGRAADYDGFATGRPDLIDFYTKNAKTKGRIAQLEKKDAAELKVNAEEHDIPTKADDRGHFKNVYSIPGNGDVFEVSDLLRMADLRGSALLDEVRGDGTTMRTEGAVISIDITYTNQAKWDVFGVEDPHYVVSAKFIPMKYYKIDYESYDKVAKTRTMHDVHGLLFLIQVKGSIRVFTIANLLTVLTTAMVSLALANTLTDVIMSYAPCLGLKANYGILKYQPTMDFSDLQDRINKVKADCIEKKIPYDPSKVKASACSKAINHFALLGKAPGGKLPDGASADDKAHIDHETMLQIICCFEQRLNNLDGMDAANSGDACETQALALRNWKPKVAAASS